MNGAPPPVATWLFDRFGCGAATEALAGDLIEEYRSGRSSLWYWRQVVAGIAVSFGHEVFSHKFLAFRALLTGTAVMFAFSWLLADPLFDWFVRSTLDRAPSMIPRQLYPSLVLGSIGFALSGWTVSRCHRPHQKAMVLLFLAFAMLGQAPRLCDLVVDAVGHPRYLPYLSGHLAGMLLTIGSVLLGGFWQPRRRTNAPRSKRRACAPS